MARRDRGEGGNGQGVVNYICSCFYVLPFSLEENIFLVLDLIQHVYLHLDFNLFCYQLVKERFQYVRSIWFIVLGAACAGSDDIIEGECRYLYSTTTAAVAMTS